MPGVGEGVWALDLAVRAGQLGTQAYVDYQNAQTAINGDPLAIATLIPGDGAISALGSECRYAAAAEEGLGDAEANQTVYRVWGRNPGNPGEAGSKAWGQYWSRVDPRTVGDYRNASGLPSENAGRFLSIGRLRSVKGVQVTEGGAAPLAGNAGGDR